MRIGKIKALIQTFSQLPYKRYWIILTLLTAICFSWWDDVLIWSLGVAWNWLVIPLYYIIEYGVLTPLIILLSKKTFQKLNMKVSMRQILAQSLGRSLPSLTYRRLKRKKLFVR